MTRRARIGSVAGTLVLAACAPATGPNARNAAHDLGDTMAADSAAIAVSLDGFLRAFELLDWDTFRRAFADDVTVFFPSAATPARFAGRDAVEARFQQEFAAIRAGAPGGPPYMQLRPVNLQIRILAPGVGTATFELKNDLRFARRTLVFSRIRGTWHIVHLHASNVPWPDKPLQGSRDAD